ncbi:MAG TPA: DEAD/DEAH box helicase [Candidatus Bathyarchaeota archaeon]|nr:DEAD/DEAH box helicase [Candidatus Bathyarchaeota archaeon]
MFKPTGAVQGVSFRKNPRNGQKQVFDKVLSTNKLNIQLPTGYGKTYTATGAYSILKANNRCNRLLFIFPTDAQLEQFVKDGPSDLREAGVPAPHKVVDVRFFGAHSIKKHLTNEAQVFAITIQSLSNARGIDNVYKLMEKCEWMVVVDEYHHYGIDKQWGQVVNALPMTYLLAMSATPARKEDDSAFGKPDVAVSYRQAQKEGAVKKLKGHSYRYRIDAVMENGEIQSMTTDDLVDQAGGDSPAAIEAMRINRKMRWSPKYVSPLVTIPIERMLQQRVSTGYRLQAIVGAMCVSHAKMVCDQVRSIFPELEIDWVGTGEDGRKPDDNKAALTKFCPPKDDDGKRNSELDVLVHVGMAGEGLDSTHVSEIVHLNKASKNNSNDQENGRASRVLGDVVGNINFDSTSDYNTMGYLGHCIMDAMDGNDPDPTEEEEGEREEGDIPELPDEPTIQIWDMELESIDSGDPAVQRMAKIMKDRGSDLDWEGMNNDLDHPGWVDVKETFHMFRKMEAREQDEKSTIMQWQDSVKSAMTVVTGRVMRMMTVNGVRPQKGLAGDVKLRINRQKKANCGPITEDIEICKRHYTWIKGLERNLIDRGLPQWLM